MSTKLPTTPSNRLYNHPEDRVVFHEDELLTPGYVVCECLICGAMREWDIEFNAPAR